MGAAGKGEGSESPAPRRGPSAATLPRRGHEVLGPRWEGASLAGARVSPAGATASGVWGQRARLLERTPAGALTVAAGGEGLGVTGSRGVSGSESP